jgi:hypothetical protein
MSKPWSEVEQSKEYKSLPPEEQSAAKSEYFDTVVTSKEEFKSLPTEEQSAARQEFLGVEEPSKPKLGMVETMVAPIMEKVFPGWGAARGQFEQQYPGVVDRARFRGQMGQAVLSGNLAGQGLTQAGVRGVGLAPSMLRGAVEGAVGSQSFDYGSVGNRIIATAGAGAFGGVVGGAVSGAIGAGRSISKTINRLKDPRIPVMSQIQEEISANKQAMSSVASGGSKQIQATGAIGREASEAISGRAKSIEDRITQSVRENKNKINSSIESTKTQIDKVVNSLDSELSREADVAAKTFQSKVNMEEKLEMKF